jgi:uncharacterized RDD family membrane protein YckC
MSEWFSDPPANSRSESDTGSRGLAGGSLSSFAVASWWSRVGAVLLDDLVLLVPGVILALVLNQYQTVHYVTSDGSVGTTVYSHYEWIDVAVWLLYSGLLLIRHGSRNGQTIGKQAAGIRVARNDGQPVDLGTVLLREGIGKGTIPALLIAVAPLLIFAFAAYWLVDYLLPLVEPENRALHDLIAGTHVVRRDEQKPARFTPSPDIAKRRARWVWWAASAVVAALVAAAIVAVTLPRAQRAASTGCDWVRQQYRRVADPGDVAGNRNYYELRRVFGRTRRRPIRAPVDDYARLH